MSPKKPSYTPPMTEARLSYSYGLKMNLGNYESADVHISRSETFDVSGMSDVDIADFMETRYRLLREEIDGKMDKEYSDVSTV